MNKKLFLLICGLLIGVLGLSVPAYSDVNRRIGNREYAVYIPAGAGPFSLIIGLHGGFGTIQGFDSNTQISTKGVRKGYVVAIPQGTGKSWNVGDCCGLASQLSVDDIGFLLSIINDVSSIANINKSRVFLMGHSNGGELAYRFASEHPEITAGAGVQSTSLGIYIPNKPANILHIHGTADTNVMYNGGISPNSGQQNISVSETIGRWVSPLTNSVMTHKIKLNNVSEDSYAGSDGHTVKLWTVEGGTHAWMDFSTDSILDFFTLHK